MSRSVPSTRVVIAVCAMAGALALAGCGAGQITQTGSQVSGVDGGSANVGQIAVRGAEFAFTGDGKTAVIYPSGGTAPLTMTVVNTGAQPDRLMTVASPVAGSVRIIGDATISGGYKLLVDGQPAAPASAPASATAPAGPARTPGAKPTPTVSAAVPSSGAVVPSSGAAAVPSSGAAAVPSSEAAAPNNTGPSANGTTSAQVVLSGLKEDLQAGRAYPVVLTFQRAGDVTVQVPVGNPGEGSSPS